MARKTELEAVWVKMKNAWRVNVPASLSPDGHRQRRFFKTETKAKAFALNLKKNIKFHGEKAVTLSSTLTTDALAAEKILARFDGVTLQTAARFYIKHHDEAGKCPTLAASFTEAMERRVNLSASYMRDMKLLAKRLPKKFMETNIFDITGKDIASALDHAAGGVTMWRNAYRTLRAILGDQVKSGTIKSNPCANVHQPRLKRKNEVVIYTPEQVQSIFNACIDYQDGDKRACSECAIPFAVLFFAGVRPVEFTRLTWENINLESGFIRLSGDITKTGRTRNIPITDTLRAWLETLPQDQRDGKIMPQDWRGKSQRVKKEAGICGREYQDAARHTYGSFTVALEGIDYVRATMGHGHTATFETHYNNALTIPQAKKYLEVMPVKLTKKKVKSA